MWPIGAYVRGHWYRYVGAGGEEDISRCGQA